MTNIYGKSTVGKDGIVYRSKFEADFANKFLFDNYVYEYEKRYPNSNHLCDFYLPNYNLWIECVYHEIVLDYAYKKMELNRIDLEVPYAAKEIAKKYGAKWDPKKKAWWVPNDGTTYLALHQFMWPRSLCQEIYLSNGKAITDKYDEILREKIFKNNGDVLVVNHKDLGQDTLFDIIRIKGSVVLKNGLIRRYFNEMGAVERPLA